MIAGTFGEALETAVITSGHDIQVIPAPVYEPKPKADQLALVHIRTHKAQGCEKHITIDAGHRATGVCIRGPISDVHHQMHPDQFNTALSASRWVMNPAVRGRNPAFTPGSPRGRDTSSVHELLSNPSIVPIHRILTTCPECGATVVRWKDELMRNSRNADGTRPERWSPDIHTPCVAKANGKSSCGCKAVRQRKLRNAVAPTDRHTDDPVISDELDRQQVLNEMKQTWENCPDPTTPTMQLPRIWAVYELGDVPVSTWRPSDPVALELTARGARLPRPLGILPFKQAAVCHKAGSPISQGLVMFWLDAVDATGWVRTEDLHAWAEESKEALGYRREFWTSQPDHYEPIEVPYLTR